MDNHNILDGLKIIDRYLGLSLNDASGHYLATARLTIKSLMNKIQIDNLSNMIRHPLALELAFEYIGLTEKVGLEHNQEILSFFKEVGHSWVIDDETPWCAAFVGAILKKAGYKHTGKLNAKSYLSIGVEVKTPELGDIVIFNRGNPAAATGHVAFFLGETKDRVFCLGGNQNNMVSVSSNSKNDLIGYRRVENE